MLASYFFSWKNLIQFSKVNYQSIHSRLVFVEFCNRILSSFLVFHIYFLHVCPNVFLFLPGLTERSCELLLQARKQCLSLEPVVRAREPCLESSGQAPVEALYWPRVTDLELQKVSRKYPFWLHSVEKFFTNCYMLVNADASDLTGGSFNALTFWSHSVLTLWSFLSNRFAQLGGFTKTYLCLCCSYWNDP